MSYRIELDLSQTQLIQRINAKHENMSGYETGASLPKNKAGKELREKVGQSNKKLGE